MSSITSQLKEEPFKVEIISPSGNQIIADEPVENGGKNLGFSPHELLLSALAACTSATVKMYALKKGWPLEEVKTNIDLTWDTEAKKTIIHRQIEFTGVLDAEQTGRLHQIANLCPVHKILSNPIDIHTIIPD